MKMFGRRALSRLEMAVYGAIVAICIALYLDRLLDVMELSERSAMQACVNRVNSAIDIQMALDRLSGQRAFAEDPRNRNPFELARTAPPNYAGEVESAEVPRAERGTWLYDRSRKEVVYLPRLHRGLRTPDPSNAIRFALIAVPNASYRLVPTSPYQWL